MHETTVPAPMLELPMVDAVIACQRDILLSNEYLVGGLTMTHVQALYVRHFAYHVDGMTQAELAWRTGTSQANISHLVRRLERRWLVRRWRHDGDRRHMKVQLTDRGLEEYESIARRWAQADRRLGHGRDPRQREDTITRLADIGAPPPWRRPDTRTWTA